jgi:phosphoglycolate phosphatase-like HAD superfamily hydrolase
MRAMTVAHPSPVVLFDVDGTLVDSNYQNVLAWYRSFRQVGLVVPLWRLHRCMGMGGDQLVPAVVGDATERRVGDEVRALWRGFFDTMIDEVAVAEGATELLQACSADGYQVILASSGAAEHVEHYVDLLGARDVIHAWTTSDDVDRTKPDPDIVVVARDRSDGGPATMVGDSPWDVQAAQRAGLRTVTVVTGGFCRAELEGAGAAAVIGSLREITADLALLAPTSGARQARPGRK